MISCEERISPLASAKIPLLLFREWHILQSLGPTGLKGKVSLLLVDRLHVAPRVLEEANERGVGHCLDCGISGQLLGVAGEISVQYVAPCVGAIALCFPQIKVDSVVYLSPCRTAPGDRAPSISLKWRRDVRGRNGSASTEWLRGLGSEVILWRSGGGP